MVLFVLGLDRICSVRSSHLKNLNWFNVKSRVNDLSLNHVFKSIIGYLCVYNRTDNVHSHNTRHSSHSLVLPIGLSAMAKGD